MTSILLVRHGETDWNKERRLQGHIDIPLNSQGVAQAALLGEALVQEKIAVVYSSDLSRAYDTANAIAHHHALPIFMDSTLRERHYGSVQGLTYEEIEERYPQNYAAWQSRDPDFQPEGGESLRDFQTRVTSNIERIANQHVGQKILIVAHGGVLDCLYRAAQNIDLAEKSKIDLLNTSLNRLIFDGTLFHIEAWGDVSHLQNQSVLDEIEIKTAASS